jgi:hypothetical protein
MIGLLLGLSAAAELPPLPEEHAPLSGDCPSSVGLQAGQEAPCLGVLIPPVKAGYLIELDAWSGHAVVAHGIQEASCALQIETREDHIAEQAQQLEQLRDTRWIDRPDVRFTAGFLIGGAFIGGAVFGSAWAWGQL